MEELSPRMFSFNSPFGACPHCDGLGTLMEIDPEMVLEDTSKSILGGGINVCGWNNVAEENSFSRAWFDSLAKHYGFSLETPIDELPKGILDTILYGTIEPVKFVYKNRRKLNAEPGEDMSFESGRQRRCRRKSQRDGRRTRQE